MSTLADENSAEPQPNCDKAEHPLHPESVKSERETVDDVVILDFMSPGVSSGRSSCSHVSIV